MLTSPLRPRFAGLALASLLLSLAACLPPPNPNEDGGTSNPDASTQVDAGSPDAGPPGVCRNGKKERDETCDDGNTTSGDGCSNRCVLEPGYTCETDGTPCGRSVTCGDGRVEGGELSVELAGDAPSLWDSSPVASLLLSSLVGCARQTCSTGGADLGRAPSPRGGASVRAGVSHGCTSTAECLRGRGICRVSMGPSGMRGDLDAVRRRGEHVDLWSRGPPRLI